VSEGATETTAKIRCKTSHEDALWKVTLDSPKGNVLDSQMVRELDDTFGRADAHGGVKAVLLSAAGKNFCFGASVEEHLPGQVAAMLTGFHGFFRKVAASGIPVLTSVRGACLGGGLELAAFSQRVCAHPTATLGQPEIKLGVFAPVASAILAERVGRGAADDLLLTGRTVDAAEALSMGLVDAIDDDPEAAVQAWAEEHILPLSASSLHLATRAARLDFTLRFEALLGQLEQMYLHELMDTHDAVEGINAFLDKRAPTWRNR
jgi:cyclohexa-1,5-dienecarbonyl-CoA hydratase